jgi:hypothetical protein
MYKAHVDQLSQFFKRALAVLARAITMQHTMIAAAAAAAAAALDSCRGLALR